MPSDAQPPIQRRDDSRRHIVLVGSMGAGKSTVGRALAGQLGLPFVDLDARIEADAGMAIAAIFSARGEDAFRRLEARALEAVLAGSRAVVATGGGVVVAEGNRRLLADAAVAYLHVSPVAQLARLHGDQRRPLLQSGDPAGTLARLQAEREPLYRAVARFELDVSSLTPAQAAGALAGHFRAFLPATVA